jgi:CheY-like chemotaxis protein
MSTLILVVEDSPSQLNYVQKLLETNNYEVLSAKNGNEAMEILTKFNALPELIISDINMPEMNGYDFFETVSENHVLNRIPFLFLSALDEPEDIRFGKLLGVDDYIIKPFKSEDLLAIVAGKIARNQKNYEYSKKINELLISELEEDLEVPMNISENIALLFVFWDDAIGPILTEYLPKDVKFSFQLDEIANQLFQAVTSIYGQTHIEKAKAEGILLNINNIKKSGYIFFDAYHDNTVRGGEREYMLAVIAPMINYFQSLKLKKILIDISHRINNKKKYNKNNYWNLIVEVLLDS